MDAERLAVQPGYVADRLTRSSPQILDHHLTAALSRVLQLHIPSVPIYANQAADELTRRAGADALAYPDRIVFRDGAYNPRSTAGLALLGHELTHVARMRTQAPGARPPDATAIAAEEREALHSERVVLQRAHELGLPGAPAATGRHAEMRAQPYPPVVPAAPNRSVERTAAGSFSPPAAPVVPRAAHSDRDIGGLPAPSVPVVPTTQEIRQLKDEIYRDLIDRIRTEFERGM